MQWFRNLRTLAKILSLVGLLLLLMLGMVGIGYKLGANAQANLEHMFRNYTMPIVWVSNVNAIAINNRRIIMSMENTRDMTVRKNFADIITAARNESVEMMVNYEKTNLTPREIEMMKRYGPLRAAYREAQDEALSILLDPDAGPEKLQTLAESLATGGRTAKASDAFTAFNDELVDLLVKLAEEANDEAGVKTKAGIVELLVSAAVSLILGLTLAVLIARMITVPISKVRSGIKLFADGDLTTRFEAEGKDELAHMGGALQAMTDKLKEIIASVKDASGHISETAQDFSSMAEETHASVEEFRANVDEMGTNLDLLASTGEEVNASVEEVAAGAQATAEKGTDIARQVDQAMSAGDEGMKSVQRAVTGIDGVARNAAESAKSVQELGTRARQIQGFVSQIGGIADQTNLLALNAAIEAARAGDAGRGFAVVAEEVRKLAEDSNAAAKNIEELAKTITGDLDNVVSLSLENAKGSEDAKELSKETEEMISKMIDYLKSISSATQDLAAVSEEQAASSEEIAEAVQSIATRVSSTAQSGENIRVGVGDIATAAEKMASHAEGLSNLSDNLAELLAFFKTGAAAAKAKPLKALPQPRKK
ncbi:methyl-accepting chemotaxis sensory transducer [Synergistales bacterium]|nr:methyl-accepting chemotaxis sensory transducer [Synergistales bacterium]GHV54401.1 methyl-accepting chemotaxis sensory transducer [Synergistales bacterium]